MNQKLGLPEKIIIVDTEYTCWPGSNERGWDRPNEYREIAQIGAILIDTKKFIELDSLNLFVKPVRNPLLSDYFINLTGITQEEVDEKGISYKDALQKIFSWSKNYDIYSFGGTGTEGDVLKENCGFINIPFPFEDSRFTNLLGIFKKYIPDADKCESSSIVSLFGKKTSLRAHNALNDVRILLDGLRELNKMA